METKKDTVVQKLAKADETIVATNTELEAKTVELKDALAKIAETKTSIDTSNEKVKALDEEIVSLKTSVADKDKSITELEAKITLVPAAADVSDGTKAVKDASTDANEEPEVDHAAKYKEIEDPSEAGEYFQAHEEAILSKIK